MIKISRSKIFLRYFHRECYISCQNFSQIFVNLQKTSQKCLEIFFLFLMTKKVYKNWNCEKLENFTQSSFQENKSLRSSQKTFKLSSSFFLFFWGKNNKKNLFILSYLIKKNSNESSFKSVFKVFSLSIMSSRSNKKISTNLKQWKVLTKNNSWDLSEWGGGREGERGRDREINMDY